MNIYEWTAQELYDSYVAGENPADLLKQSRMDLATRLQVEEGLKQEEAYRTDQSGEVSAGKSSWTRASEHC